MQVPNCALPLRKKDLPQDNSPGKGCLEGHQVQEPGLGVAVEHNHQGLLLILPDFSQGLFKEAHWEKQRS